MNMISPKFKTYILLAIFSVLSMINVSCVDEHYYYRDPLWGSWILVYDDYGLVDPNYAEIFCFESSGYGTLDWIDNWGRNHVDDFTWSARGSNLDIYYYDGDYEYYNFYFSNGNLVLDDGYHYREYRRY